MPEDLSTPEKSIAQIEKEQMQRLISWLFSGFITIVAVLLIVGAITLFIFK